MDGANVARLVQSALDVTPAPPRTQAGRFTPTSLPPEPEVADGLSTRPDQGDFLARLRHDFPEWAIVADLRGGRWAAANGIQEIWRCDGIELRRALIAATGKTHLLSGQET